MVEKVTDEAVKVNNPHLRKVMTDQGIDPDYVELVQDYAPRKVNGKMVKGRSPYARFYKDRVSGKGIMEVSILPHCTPEGQKIECGWVYEDGEYKAKTNLFAAEVKGYEIKVICLCDQPHGAKNSDWVSWKPQLFLNGIEQLHTEATLLTTDPINAGYHDNTIEWDYGICKRRIRIIEGRIREKWVFTENPSGEVRVKHNHEGGYPLKLLTGKINDDEELIPVSVFDEAEYPLEMGASPETFFPDPHDEVSSVDGYVVCANVGGTTWTGLVGSAGTDANDSGTTLAPLIFRAHTTQDEWDLLRRSIILFDTSGLPDTATKTGATLSLKGTSKADPTSNAPTVNIYKSTPFSNIALQADDFVDIGTVALSAVIAYADWATDGYNDFALIDVDADDFGYIPVDGVTKLGARNANYDVAEELDPGNHTPTWASGALTNMLCNSADQGNTTSDPKLVVTYTSGYSPSTRPASMAAKLVGARVI